MTSSRGSDNNNNNNIQASSDLERKKEEEEEKDDFFPSSVEEAGALLGMAITQLTLASSPPMMAASSTSLAPPAGMHSSFRVMRSISNTSLLTRLYELRALLRSSSSQEPMVAAPSLLAVLIKLIGVSTSLAPAYLGSGSGGGSSGGPPTTVLASAADAAAGFANATVGVGGAVPTPPPRPPTPPMFSNVLRHLWVDCVTLCHVRGAGLTGSSRINTSQFIRQMLALASQNPRTARAAGGVRIAALDAIAALLTVDEENPNRDPSDTALRIPPSRRKGGSPPLVLQTAPWALDILQVCLKALRSAGNGEATYRPSAVNMAIAVAMASRRAQLVRLEQQQFGGGGPSMPLLLQGGLEEKALVEATKFLRQAMQDKVPEVRLGAAQFASHLAPLLISKESTIGGHGGSAAGGPMSIVEEVLTLAWRNLDEESPYTAHAWAEAIARILVTVLHFKASQGGGRSNSTSVSPTNKSGGNTSQSIASGSSSGGGNRGGIGEDSGSGSDADPSRPSRSSRGGGRMTLLSQATSLKRVLTYLVDQFVKVGGELVATRLGGSFSTGGRAVRVGIGLVMSHLLRLRHYLGDDIHSSSSNSMTLLELIQAVLNLLGPDMDKQLRPASAASDGLSASLGVGAAFVGSSNRNWSKADSGIARAVTCRILRDGIATGSPEPMQLALLQDLVSLLPTTSASAATGVQSQSSPATAVMGGGAALLNANQLQCILVELSHLMATLGGEGITAKVSELVAALKPCLEHEDAGVRHEAAVACHSLCVAHPDAGRELVCEALINVQMHHAQLMTISSARGGSAEEEKQKGAGKMRMFRRKTKEATSPAVDAETLPHLRAIHGLCLIVAMLVREMPHGSGGLPADLSQTVASVGEILIASQFNDILGKASGGAVCTCVRSGYNMISAIMATGPKVISKHVPQIFSAWQRACNGAKVGGKYLAPHHDLVCIDAVLYSVVVFLKYCSELLLAIPEALTQITVLLEELLPLLMSDGKLGGLPLSPRISTRLESARASLLESFAWLPAGSYPMVADSVFAFASENIQAAVYSEISCSILQDLLCQEDAVLDTSSLARVKRHGQSGAATDLDQTILLLTAEFSHPQEREAVLHLHDRNQIIYLDGRGQRFRQSFILASHCKNKQQHKPPTPLHEVGMWRKPIDPSSSAKIRLVDAAVQAFAATFGLKSGREQQSAMSMLEALVPQYFAQITRSLNSSLTEQSKSKDDNAPVTNITAVLLLCLQSLPLHEATHDVPIGLGPPWMNKAKDILLALLPYASNAVRRAAAEGLALLATLGVTEDAHFLQSTVLHSLDEVRQGNKPDGKPRAIALEPVSAARAGSLLTLACIQRTEHKITQRQLERARGRVEHSQNAEPAQTNESQLPVLQMMTRILPSIGNYGFTDFFEVRAFALQSFQILLAYSSRLDKPSLDTVDKQLLRKAVEIVEDNVCSAWIVASHDLDKGHESEKIGSECCFLAVVLRFMSFVFPYLKILKPEDDTVVRRFAIMARLIMERNGGHPSIACEGMIFYEVMAEEVRSLPTLSDHILPVENLKFSMVPTLVSLLRPVRPEPYAANGIPFSFDTLRAAVFVLHALADAELSPVRVVDVRIVSLLMAMLESVTGCKQFLGTGFLRSMVVSRRIEFKLCQTEESVGEITRLVPRLILDERTDPKTNYRFHLRCVLLAKALLSGVGSVEEEEGEPVFDKDSVTRAALLVARGDAADLFAVAAPPRWQSKTLAAQIASCCLREIISTEHQSDVPKAKSHHFNTQLASARCEKQCQEAQGSGKNLPNSLVAFHLQDLIASSCMSSVASLDQSELFSVQESSLHFLSDVITSFCQIPDPEMPGSDLLHQYSQQIYSVVKHCLNSIDEIQTEGSFRVFLTSCSTVSVIIKEKMTTEPPVVKRLIRPLVPTSEQLAFGSITERKPDSPFSEAGSYSKLIKIAKVSFTGDLLFGQDVAEKQSVYPVSAELIEDRKAFGVESALVALEGARLLTARNLSLVGTVDRAETGQTAHEGVLSADDYHSDFTAMHLVANSWPSCSRASLCAFSLGVREESTTETERQECFRWMKALGTVVLSGCADGIGEVSEATRRRGAFSIDAEVVVVECLQSLALLLRVSDILPADSLDIATVGNIAAAIQQKIVEPLVTRKTSILQKTDVINQLCSLYQDLSLYLVRVKDTDEDKAALFSLILCPLNVLQRGKLTSERDPIVANMINASQSGVGILTRNGQLPAALVRSLVDFIARQLLQSKDAFAIQLHKAAKSLLLDCMSHPAVKASDKKRVLLQMAQAGQWDVWGIIYKANLDLNVTDSLETLKRLFVNAMETDAHVAALSALGAVINSGKSVEMVGRVIAFLGVEVMGLLHHYGTLASTRFTESTKRQQCFADSLKVVLELYHQLLQESYLAEFLSTIFETFIAVLRFNGLPNHPSPQEKGEAGMGRLVAQAVLHVARTSPEPFKTSMGTLNEQDRTILEFSVRGEMTGYAQTGHGQAPAKKKLNLKSFKK